MNIYTEDRAEGGEVELLGTHSQSLSHVPQANTTDTEKQTLFHKYK